MNKVVHFEIPADDLERAKRFYSSVFGWSIFKVGTFPEADYHLANTVATDERGMPKEPGAINGGMRKRMVKGEAPVVVVKVANLDEAMEKVKVAGGQIVLEKQPVGDFGLYARFRDPEGNVMGLWQDVK